jgi:hypothetical protein
LDWAPANCEHILAARSVTRFLRIQVNCSFIFAHVNAQIVTSVTLSQQTALNHIRNALFATRAGEYNNLKATLLLPAKLVNFAGYLT